MSIAGFKAYRRMGYLPEVPVWDAMHSCLSAGSFSGLQSGLHLNMTRFCGKSRRYWLLWPFSNRHPNWFSTQCLGEQFKVSKHSACQSSEASIGYNTDRQTDQQHNWATERPWMRFWGPKIVASSCTYVGLTWVKKVIIINI